MGLFATLTSQASETVKKNSSSLEQLPTIVQLYSSSNGDQLSATAAATTSSMLRFEQSAAQVPSYAVLSYSAVPVTTTTTTASNAELGDSQHPETPLGGGSTRGASAKKMLQSIVPELGVWNCNVVTTRGSAGSSGGSPPSWQSELPLLQIPRLPPTFCLTVDTTKPSQVEPTLTSLQEALVRALIEKPPATAADAVLDSNAGGADATEAGTTTSRTTTLHDLRSISFGLAPDDEASAKKMKGDAAPDEQDRKVAFCLVVCALLPATGSDGQPEDEYRERQERALLVYHLRKYAAALNAHLCFVGEPAVSTSFKGGNSDQDEDKENPIHQQPAISTRKLSVVLRDLAAGKALDLANPELGGAAAAAPSSSQNDPELDASLPLVYGPANHNADLIESVLLRNAQYPGKWDASKDSLWKILPAEKSANPVDDGRSANSAPGDDGWLKELLQSVGGADPASAAKTPSKGKKTPMDGKTPQGQKTPNDAAVSDFFTSLLSK